MYPYTGITFIVCCVIAYKVLRRLYAWNDAAIKRRDAQRKIRELDAAIRLARLLPPPPPPVKTDPTATWPNRNPITGTAGEWDHIPRIAFDLDTQLEFGGSRYHTFYVSPDDDCVLEPGLYITDKREGPELIGASSQKRIFIPYDQLIKRPCSVCGNELESGARFCDQCGASIRTGTQDVVQPATQANALLAATSLAANAPSIANAMGAKDGRGILRRLFSTQGRIGRKGFWFFQLFEIACILGAVVIGSMFKSPNGSNYAGTAVLIAIAILFLPGWGVAMKRAHDLNCSGGFAVATVVPIAGWIVLLILAFKGGTPGLNDYGLPNSGAIFRKNS